MCVCTLGIYNCKLSAMWYNYYHRHVYVYIQWLANSPSAHECKCGYVRVGAAITTRMYEPKHGQF